MFNEEPKARVIDNNGAVGQLVRQLADAYKNNPEEGEKAEFFEEESGENGEAEEGFREGLFAPGAADINYNPVSAAPAPKPTVDYDAIAKAEATRIVDAAGDKAAQILLDAKEEAAKLRENAVSEGHDEGFNAGINEGRGQMEQMAAENEEKFKARMDELENEYITRFESMEEQITSAVAEVFEKVFGDQIRGNREILLFLVKGTLSHIENSKEFHIKVSRDREAFLKEHADELRENLGSDAIFEIIADGSITSDDCFIETENGVFDCGSATQLDNLMKDLRALA